VRLARTLVHWIGLLAGLWLLMALSWIVWDNWFRQPPDLQHVATNLRDPLRIASGAYLARVGNCAECHTARGAAPLAGGRGIATPFGTVYSSNLTPDSDTGLGRWSADDFWTALHLGRSRDGRLLTPAFPYNHTTLITRQDSDDLWAWLQAQPPAHQPNRAAELQWPAGTQPVLAVWRSLFFRPGTFKPDGSRTEPWNRGAYLVQGLGHCAACHGPRNVFGAGSALDNLSGSRIAGLNWYATNLHSERESGMASTPLPDLVRLLRTGQGPGASFNGPMREVVLHSLQHLRDEDLLAMGIYLKSLVQSEVPAQTPSSAPTVRPQLKLRGQSVYAEHCAQCHGDQGQGFAGLYPALAGNRAVVLDDPTNLIQMVLRGGYAAATKGHPQPFGMPPYMFSLPEDDMAAVLTHLRTQWGHQATAITPLQVHRVRSETRQ
jgi:mono/diheme cytochrome c family protein